MKGLKLHSKALSYIQLSTMQHEFYSKDLKKECNTYISKVKISSVWQNTNKDNLLQKNSEALKFISSEGELLNDITTYTWWEMMYKPDFSDSKGILK